MPRTLAILLLLAAPAVLAQDQERKPFPDDYVPSPCADVAPVCQTFRQSQFASIAAKRGFDLGQEWVDAHWAEINAALGPTCRKVASCFAANNSFIFCNDVIAPEAYHNFCDKYEEGTTEHRKCRQFATMFLFGADRASHGPWEQIRTCGKEQTPAGERKLEWWMMPAKLDRDYVGNFKVYTIDSETHVPISARLNIDVKPKIYASNAPDGLPNSFYHVPWTGKLARVPNAEGHRDVVPPEVKIEAEGYETITFRLPIDITPMNVTMSPEPSKLKRGKNTVTITATDALTGKPVEARVMMGTHTVLGKTNVPFELELAKGQKREEIWVTSLFDRYSDVIVAKAEK